MTTLLSNIRYQYLSIAKKFIENEGSKNKIKQFLSVMIWVLSL